ncbi:Imm50 family immunity protein [Streptomyces sp. NPDC050355]|uniref:Imm50 family immunity protein n=1 Tax=Streptomyces sp. NPDC050355 TaxID=3365609 RepID=UPI00379850FD
MKGARNTIHMIQNWEDLISSTDKLREHYSKIPPLAQVTLRSIHLSQYGPTIILRLDLPTFPDRPLPEWTDQGCDRLQCHVRFLAVEDFSMRRWEPPVMADVQMEPLEKRRIKVDVLSSQTNLSFTSNDSLTVGRISAFRAPDGGPDRGKHHYVGRMDRLKYDSVPDPEVEVYYERF